MVRMASAIKMLIRGSAGTAVIAATVAALGKLRTTHLITVTRQTTAEPEHIWPLWEDVPARVRWDDGLDWIRLDEGPFALGATGHVKLKGQSAVRFEIIECDPMRRYTDRFFLPGGTFMDWEHTIEDRGDGTREVTFKVVVKGPTALVLTPIMKKILGGALPETVDRLVSLAEETAKAGRG
ncbi:hypothetical protein DI270_007020 [Microbispora triticiradicis]|uniref:SRPBCC family protein n=4 Tax=Streptosporangiaceae TaxID=2004 RepID=A0ABY3LSR1_9ACTN|nr:hypothetical protein DI270_007020 [Microbispora triticiradicis]TLP51926.1 hypothetical protein FED44_33300 [Microbispora fusca]TYB52460.1 hypothetical protein FXF59_24760 [Microbispora tritici]